MTQVDSIQLATLDRNKNTKVNSIYRAGRPISRDVLLESVGKLGELKMVGYRKCKNINKHSLEVSNTCKEQMLV